MDIRLIPDEELEEDLRESMVDMTMCELALLMDVTEYSGGSVMERLVTNRRIIEKIEAEQERRRLEHEKDAEVGPLVSSDGASGDN